MQFRGSANAHSVNADKQRVYEDTVVINPTMFRVSPVMTTSIRLRILICDHNIIPFIMAFVKKNLVVHRLLICLILFVIEILLFVI